MSKGKKPWLKYTAWAITFLQLAIIIGMVVLHNLATTKMGVNRHIGYRRQQALNTWLGAPWDSVWLGVFFLVVILSLIILWRGVRHKIEFKKQRTPIIFFGMGVAVLIQVGFLESWILYPYGIVLTLVIGFLQSIKVLIFR